MRQITVTFTLGDLTVEELKAIYKAFWSKSYVSGVDHTKMVREILDRLGVTEATKFFNELDAEAEQKEE